MADPTGILQFKRVCRVLLAQPVPDFKNIAQTVLEVTDLRVQYKVSRSLGKEPNTAEITITNLCPEHRALIQQKGGKFVLEAGYEAGTEQLFVGDVRNVSHVRKGADWESVIKSGDGERAYRFARVNKTYKAGTRVGDVIKELGAALGLAPGNIVAEAATFVGEYLNGFTTYGPAAVELDRILRAQGYSWSIQEGAIQLLKNGATSKILIPDLSPETGLVGSPEFGAAEKNKGPVIKGKCLLQPKIKPGGRLHLKSERFNGNLRITKVEHEGDTEGGNWYSSFEGEPL